MTVAVVRFAFAILFDALAFVVWDVGTRPPQRLAHDVAAAARSRRAFAYGALRFAAGALLLVFAMLIAQPAIPSMRVFTIVETIMLVAALLVEQLVGADLRRVSRRGRQTSR